jgi:tRNA 2-thiocytidine biosynthesis protein TtcA
LQPIFKDMTQFTEEEKTIRRIERRFNKGVVQYGLIEEGDKILIGLSGGKDSLALVELLGRRARIYKPRFSVVAVHVVMKNIPYQSDTESEIKFIIAKRARKVILISFQRTSC